MKIKCFTKKIHVMLDKISEFDKKITRKVKEFVFGTTRCKSLTEPAKLDKKIIRSIYPIEWNPNSAKCYNDWCETNNVSTVYHIKQTNNLKWK